MKINFRTLIGAMALMCCSMASAQHLNSAYFLDGYAYGNRLNPAKDYDRKGYVSFPFLGNVNFGMYGNTGLTDIFMDYEGDLVSFLDSKLSTEKALAGFSENNSNRLDLNMDILGFGFHKWGGFNTFNVSMRTNVAFEAPYSFFETAREFDELDPMRDYDFSGIKMDIASWAEIGFGHSRKITDAWRVGGKVKVLLGFARAKVDVSEARLTHVPGSDPNRFEDEWHLTTDAKAEVNLKGFTWGETDQKKYADGSGYYDQINFDNMDVDGFGVNGWGLGFDLGAEWDLGKQGWLEGMTVSASLLDLGFISWNNTNTAYNDGKEVIYDAKKVSESVDPGIISGGTVPEKIDGDAVRISDLLAIQKGETKSITNMLGATLNIGVEYQMPFYKKLSAGFLSTTRIQGAYSWNEERFSATVSPLKWLEASVNVGFGTLGTSFGWVANIHPKGFNLFVGMDHIMDGFSSHGIPSGNNTSLTVGINIPFGDYSAK